MSLFLSATISDKEHCNKCAQLKTDVCYGAVKICLRQHSNKNLLIWSSWYLYKLQLKFKKEVGIDYIYKK